MEHKLIQVGETEPFRPGTKVIHIATGKRVTIKGCCTCTSTNLHYEAYFEGYDKLSIVHHGDISLLDQ